uniref:Alpha/beta hydrolase fold-3 domain-containing protein n=1 Tax=Eutreptiella gymnastica TaxID=73025 RepID=A0A7S1NJ14_9EUGL|mmetsp:Transcript_38078/g.68016  ORF Transcript_38078/g.68016 Transcript_38078/m.68016 type:complete len:404 (+) Transcript_38078:2-1213(+)
MEEAETVWQKTKTLWNSATNVAATSSTALTDGALVLVRRVQGSAGARPTWTVPFEMAITTLRAAAKTVARDVQTIRMITDNALPRVLLPAGVSYQTAALGPGMPDGEWFWPTGSPTTHRTILFLHGGAFCTCSSSTHRNLLGLLVQYTKSTVLAVDYRRPPENPFPAPLEDAAAAYEWLLQRMPTNRIVIAGDSAGGGLGLTLMVALKKAGRPLPGGAVLLSPWVELKDTYRDSWTRNAGYDFLDSGLATYFARAYAGGQDMDHPKLSPVNADLTGLPPIHIEVGECEMLLDQVFILANRLSKAAVDVRLVVAEDMVHVFPMFTFAFPTPMEDGEPTSEPFRAFERIRDFLDNIIPASCPSTIKPSEFIDLTFEEWHDSERDAEDCIRAASPLTPMDTFDPKA